MGIAGNLLNNLGWVPSKELPTEPPDAVISLSYALMNTNSLTPMTESVTLAAADLFKLYDGRPFVFFTTSDHLLINSRKDAEIEAEIRTNLLIKNGVNREKIISILNTSSTRSEMINFKAVLYKRVANPRRIILCTHYLHSRRALEMFQKSFPDLKIYNYPVICDEYVNNLLPSLRRLSGRSELLWASYMVIVWILNKIKLI